MQNCRIVSSHSNEILDLGCYRFTLLKMAFQFEEA